MEKKPPAPSLKFRPPKKMTEDESIEQYKRNRNAIRGAEPCGCGIPLCYYGDQCKNVGNS